MSEAPFRILIPVDFSPAAESALAYAIQVADQVKAEAIAFHAYPLQPKSSFLSLEDILALESQAEAEASDLFLGFLEQFQQRHSELDTSRLTRKLRIGFAVENVISITENESIDLIIMGTRGAGNIQTRLLGTNTSVIMDNVQVPVIAVPLEGSHSMPRRIVFAIDLKHTPNTNLASLDRLVNGFGSSLTLVHVNTSSSLRSHAEIESAVQFWRDRYPNNSVNGIELNASDVERAIMAFVEEHESDLLVMSTRSRSVFERIFEPSKTRHASLTTRLPLMALHVN
jgi:nucleotide-binding universal stress UspA family protein